ncbi:venom serine carboxypeptidase-like, partial [Vespula maculifrons]
TIREIDFPPFVVLTNTLLIRSIRSSKQLSRRVLSRRVILTTLASCNISRNLIYIDNQIGTGYNFTQNDKSYASNETQVARHSLSHRRVHHLCNEIERERWKHDIIVEFLIDF